MTLLRDNYVALFQGVAGDTTSSYSSYSPCPNAPEPCVATDSRAWRATINNTAINTNALSNFQCLRDETDCSAVAAPTSFVPIQANNTIAFGYDPRTDTEGFNVNGNATCSSFSTITPDNDCPVRITFSWQPRCTAPCPNPYIDIIIDFSFAFEAGSQLAGVNPDRFDTIITRQGNANTIIPGGCPANQVLIGFNNDGTLNCQTIAQVAPDPCGSPWNRLNDETRRGYRVSACCGCCNANSQVFRCQDGTMVPTSGSADPDDYDNMTCNNSACPPPPPPPFKTPPPPPK